MGPAPSGRRVPRGLEGLGATQNGQRFGSRLLSRPKRVEMQRRPSFCVRLRLAIPVRLAARRCAVRFLTISSRACEYRLQKLSKSGPCVMWRGRVVPWPTPSQTIRRPLVLGFGAKPLPSQASRRSVSACSRRRRASRLACAWRAARLLNRFRIPCRRWFRRPWPEAWHACVWALCWVFMVVSKGMVGTTARTGCSPVGG